MLTRIQAQLPHLSKSERRVGEWILQNPRAALEHDTRWLAQQVEVSQPTLVRLAHSLGCAGFQDFRLKLAHELGEARSVEGATITSLALHNDTDSLCGGLFDYSIHALGRVRDTMDRSALDSAVKLLDAARRVTIFGFGNAVTVADEAARRLLRMEMHVTACNDPHLQSVVAPRMHAGDLLILIAHEGRAQHLVDTVTIVRGMGGKTLALTTSGAPLQPAVDVALCIDVPDSGDALTPSVAQLAQLVVIDLLSIAVAARRSKKLVAKARARTKGQ